MCCQSRFWGKYFSKSKNIFPKIQTDNTHLAIGKTIDYYTEMSNWVNYAEIKSKK